MRILALRRATDWCIAGLLTVIFSTAALVFLATRPDMYPPPQGCETDRHYTTAAHLICGELRHPHTTVGLLYPLATAAVSHWVEPTYHAGKLVNLFFGGLLVGLIYLVALAHTRSRAMAIGAAGLVGANATFFFYGTLACTDLMAAFFGFLSLYLALQSLRTDRHWSYPLMAGIAGAVACLVRDQYYFFVFGAAISAVALPRFNAKDRLWNLGGIAVGFATVLAIYTVVALSYFRTDVLDVLGWAAAFNRRREIVDATTGETHLWRALGLLLPRYRLSAALVYQAAGYVTILGLIGAAVFIVNRRLRSIAAAPWIPLAVYFLGIGWFTTSNTTIVVDRMFLIFVPVFAIFFSAGLLAFASFLFGRQKTLGRIVGLGVVLAVTVGIGLAQLPKMPHFERRNRSPLIDVRAAEVFRLRHIQKCEMVLTPSLDAATEFNRTDVVEDPFKGRTLDNAWLARVLANPPVVGERRPCFVMLPDSREQNRLVTGEPFGPGGRYRLELLDHYRDRVFYRIWDQVGSEPGR